MEFSVKTVSDFELQKHWLVEKFSALWLRERESTSLLYSIWNLKKIRMRNEGFNLFTTSDPPNIRIPILQIFVFVIEGGQENIFLLVENIFWTNEKMFSCPPSITKTNIWRIGIRIFGESDVVNKL